jgi:hypothetical protein
MQRKKSRKHQPTAEPTATKTIFLPSNLTNMTTELLYFYKELLLGLESHC